MVEAFVILGGVVIVLLAVGLVVASRDVGRKGQPDATGRGFSQARRDARRPGQRAGSQRGYLFISQPWS
ncbi:hypothetical protein [Amycolatopsis silviterrae]|uniref:Uncharacterized protein n=1 Tax=Amycolatopsis silviterrae TaxID=1656914 RepID=A0ABW5HBE1_9PSEU